MCMLIHSRDDALCRSDYVVPAAAISAEALRVVRASDELAGIAAAWHNDIRETEFIVLAVTEDTHRCG